MYSNCEIIWWECDIIKRTKALLTQPVQSIQNKEGKRPEKCVTAFDNRNIKETWPRDRWMLSAVICSELSATGARTVRRRLIMKIDLKGKVSRRNHCQEKSATETNRVVKITHFTKRSMGKCYMVR